MTTIQRAYKVELDPNNKQVTALRCHAGCARWAYNWGLSQKIESYRETGKSPNAIELHRDLNVLKKTEIPWMYNVSKCAPQEIVRNADVICIESLNVSGMLRNHRLARALSDASLSEFLRQLVYKAEWAGVEIVEADRFFPSSKTCSDCGNVKSDLSLSDRTYSCDECGLSLDRDLNAAINLKSLAGSSPVTACGEDVRPLRDVSLSVATSTKQEPNTKATPC